MGGDEDFDRFFLHHYEGLVRSLTAVTGDREVADDCVQEAFIRAYPRWRRVRRYDNPAAWIRRVAINLSHDAARSDQRRRRREDRAWSGCLPKTPEQAESMDTALDLVELLQQLTRQQRAVAALFYVEDLPVADIAISLGLSPGAVKFHLNRARSSLKILLEAEEVTHG